MIPTFGRILVANGLLPIILKLNVGLPSRTKRFAVQFFFCTLFAIVIAAVCSPMSIGPAIWVILILGMVNGFAAYAQWKAIDISLSKTSLFTFWDDIIAMSLSYFLLNERELFAPGLYIGLVLSLGAVIVFTFYSSISAKRGDHSRTPARFFLYVGFYSVVWGVATFLMRYFGVSKISTGSFLVPWYAGAFASSLVLLWIGKRNGKAEVALTSRDVKWMFVLALGIFSSLALAYTAYRLAPQNVIQPFFLVGEMIFPAMVGLYLFAERKTLHTMEKICFFCAVVGGVVIALNVP